MLVQPVVIVHDTRSWIKIVLTDVEVFVKERDPILVLIQVKVRLNIGDLYIGLEKTSSIFIICGI